MIERFPRLDPRGLEQILEQVRLRAPYYVPQWRAGERGDPGAALLRAFARMMEVTIQRLNRVPEKSLIRFLNMLGVELIPPRPSRVPLTFALSAGASGSVTVPARFQAAGAPAEGGDPVIFETEKAIAATSAPLKAVFSVDPRRDLIFDHSEEQKEGQPLRLFDGAGQMQQHLLYLGDSRLFNLTAAGALHLEITSGAPELLRSESVRWQWNSAEGEWSDFEVKGEGTAFELHKPAGEIVTAKVNQIESRWIRLKTAQPLVEVDPLSRFSLTEILAAPGKIGLHPEAAFRNDVPLLIPPVPPDRPILPFGRRPRLGDAFHLAHQEAFSKPGATISIKTALVEGHKAEGRELELSWEYWGGFGWKALVIVEDATNQFTQSGLVSFQVPDDLQPIAINGLEGLWVRVRIASGDYGEEKFSEGATPDRSSILPPNWASLTLSYSLPSRRPEAIQAFNNLEYALWQGGKFFPFRPLADSRPALYLGLGAKLEKSPVSLFLALREQGDPGGSGPPLQWQYSLPPSEEGHERWEILQALDSTRNLFEPGVVEFPAPAGFAAISRFAQELFWIRIVDQEGRFHPLMNGDSPLSPAGTLPAPVLEGLHLNTTWAIQTETVEGEIVGSSDGSRSQRFNLARFPVVEEAVWVDELASLSESERQALRQQNAGRLRETLDEDGAPTAFQVRWRPIDDLLDAGPSERVYAIDRVSGEILFGDGKRGRIPPFGIDNVRADYQTGGGARGNLAALAIQTLRTTLPFIDSVANPLPSGGGSDTEQLEQALQRGPQRIRNRGRAVTCLDFEWLAREASATVARAKCLSSFNPKQKPKTNCVTVVVVPHSESPRPRPSVALRRSVEQYLLERAANVTAEIDRLHLSGTQPSVGEDPSELGIRVIGPTYFEVRVAARLIPQTLDQAPLAEAEALSRLHKFLHPLTGGSLGRGWEFGRSPCLSDLYALLESIQPVDHVEKLSMTLTETDSFDRKGQSLLIAEGSLAVSTLPEHALIYSGEHNIAV